MIEFNEQIIFVSQADVIASIRNQNAMSTGFISKKILITTKRLLVFESLSNKIQEIQYELVVPLAKKVNAKSQKTENKYRISVNEYPEFAMDLDYLQCKVIIEEQPNCFKYFQKNGIRNLIKSSTGIVILKNLKKMRINILSFGSIRVAIRFAKALICAQAWKKYRKFCSEIKCDINYQWVKILIEMINNQNSVVLVDPDLFLSGTAQEMQSFVCLMTLIPFAHCYHHRYSLTTKESASYCIDLINSVEAKIHSLNLERTCLQCPEMRIIFSKVALANLMQLDLQHNQLNDEVFDVLQKVLKSDSKKLAFINLSYNLCKLSNPLILIQFLKSTSTILHLNISYNLLDDSCVDAIEKFIIYSMNPPLEELNLSYNKFSRKGVWRLYVGNLRNFKHHPYMRLLIYPVPIKRDIFSEQEVDFPRHKDTINMNVHSALMEEFEQESMLKHTFEDALNLNRQHLTIKFIRVLGENVKLPMNKQELNKTLQISHKVQNFIYSNQSVEKIYEMGEQLKNFAFEVPPITRTHFIKFIYQKFNEALFIRDHYSVRYLFKTIRQLEIPYDGYNDRLQKLSQRNKIFANRAENILNFQVDQININTQLDQIVKEGLRLYLEGKGVEILYYLKYKRDQFIERFLNQKMNPEHYLFDLMAKKNISADQNVSEKQFIVPYEIRLEKKINENFYLHPWQANYQILSTMRASTFDACLQFLEESEKKQKFALYFDRIQERIEFIKNEFTYFTYNKFRASYSDLKVNACRLIYLYNNITNTSLYLEIPIYVKKKIVTPERAIVVHNQQRFQRDYHIINYININIAARKFNIYNYSDIMTGYEEESFKKDVNKSLEFLRKIFGTIEKHIMIRTPLPIVMMQIISSIKDTIEVVRHSLFPEELKEEIYLHLITWRRGKFGSNNQIIELIPAFTMYMKPPLTLEKFIVAAILETKDSEITSLPLCLVANVNEPTKDNISYLDQEFVERDWIPTDQVFCQLFLKKGRVTLEIQLLEKKKIMIEIPESKTVSQLMDMLIGHSKLVSDDRENFWIYKLVKEGNKDVQEIIPYEYREHIGEILADIKTDENILVLRRRIYCRQLKYIYHKYEEGLISSLYHDLKFDYLCRGFFIHDKKAIDIASIIFIIDCIENFQLLQKQENKNKKSHHEDDEINLQKVIIKKLGELDSTYLSYIPRKVYTRLMKPKEVVINELKSKVSERCLKKEYTALFEMKLNFLKLFEKHPQFMSTNYSITSKDARELRVSINAMYIYIDSEQQSEFVHLEKIISIIPKSKYLLMYYHKHENIVAQWAMFGQEKIIIAMAMDILSYCSMRIKMSSSNLYEIHHIEELEVKIKMYEQNLKAVYDKKIQRELNKCKEELEACMRKIYKMSLTLMQLKELQYHQPNLYIKSEIGRKLYANRTEKKLEIKKTYDEEEILEVQSINNHIIEVIFPQLYKDNIQAKSYYKEHLKLDQDGNIDYFYQPPRNRKEEEDKRNQSLQYIKQYEQLDQQFKQTNPKHQEIEQQRPPNRPTYKNPPTPPSNQYTQKKEPMHSPPPPMEEEHPDPNEVVTGKKGSRGDRAPPRRRNR